MTGFAYPPTRNGTLWEAAILVLDGSEVGNKLFQTLTNGGIAKVVLQKIRGGLLFLKFQCPQSLESSRYVPILHLPSPDLFAEALFCIEPQDGVLQSLTHWTCVMIGGSKTYPTFAFGLDKLVD